MKAMFEMNPSSQLHDGNHTFFITVNVDDKEIKGAHPNPLPLDQCFSSIYSSVAFTRKKVKKATLILEME